MSPSGFQVELDLFSGRPNPTWPLTAEESQDLLARISRLSPGGGGPVPAGLGYRGFIVYRVETGRPQRWMRVGRGTIWMTGQKETQPYRDTEGIEDWLRNQAIARGFGTSVPGAS